MHVFICTQVPSYYLPTLTYIRAWVYAHMRVPTYPSTHMHTYISKYKHAHINILTYIYIYIHKESERVAMHGLTVFLKGTHTFTYMPIQLTCTCLGRRNP